MPMLIDNVPQTGEPMRQFWVFVSRDDKTGKENVCSFETSIGEQPMMTGNPHILQIMLPVARKAAKATEDLGLGKTIRLLKFTHMEEVEDWK